MSLNGVERLRDKRGDQQVTFADVADHLEDFVNRHPDSRQTVEQLASFLARVEDVDHEHDGGSGSSAASEASVVRTPEQEEGPALGP